MSCCSMECSPGWNAIHDLFSNSCQVRDEKFKSHQSHLSETWQNTDFTDVYNTFLVDIFVDRIMFDTCWTIIIPYLWLELYRIDRLLISYLMHRSQQWVWTMRIDVTEGLIVSVQHKLNLNHQLLSSSSSSSSIYISFWRNFKISSKFKYSSFPPDSPR